MKLNLNNKKGTSFIISLLVLLTITILGLAILINSSTENKISRNLKTKTEAFYVAETGAQRTLRKINDTTKTVHLYYNDPNHLGIIFLNVNSGNGIYTTTLASEGTDSKGNTILNLNSTGKIPSNNSVKKINEKLLPSYTNANPFQYAAFGINGITFLGSNAIVDSYNSNNGPYGGLNVLQNGDIGTNSIKDGIISLNNSKINGDVIVGPGGYVSVAITQESNAVLSGSKYSLSKEELFKNVQIPPETGPGTDLNIQGENIVTIGPVPPATEAIYYYKSISIGESGQLKITGKVKIYVSGTINVAGNGIINESEGAGFPGDPKKLDIRVTSNSDVKLAGNAAFYGGISAPNSTVSIVGGESLTDKKGMIFGSVVGSTISFTGNVKLHYDEGLGQIDMGTFLSSYRISSWKETK